MSEQLAPADESMAVSAQWRDAAAEFAASRVALAALSVLLLIVAVAIFAPLVSPQDPYDLTVIDVGEGRQPPGSAKLTPLKTMALRARIPAAGGDALLSSRRKADERLLATLKMTAELDATGRRLRLTLTAAAQSDLAPLHKLMLSGLPRGSTIAAAVKDKYRSRWTVPPELAGDIVVTLPKALTSELKLRIDLLGGTQRHVMTYWLGTDAQGRDVLSAIFYGLRVSLAVAITSVVVALTFGTLIGLYSGYRGGRFDAFVMRIVDMQLSFPTILVALILLAVLGKGVGNVMLALIIVQWAFYARTARGIALGEGSKEYIDACRCLSLPTSRIIVVHLLPNCLPPLIVVATLQVAGAISLEATLSFLGLGMPVTQPSLGLLIANGFEYLLSGYPWISVIPGVALLITVVSINLVGDELRDIMNPRLKH
ncbi:MAG: ABC transporter permease [Chromatiales bacterium]|nr:ABC transporter permease [Chromatiales bacterium]